MSRLDPLCADDCPGCERSEEDWSAFSITNPASTVSFSCSHEELALIMNWLLAQAKAWEGEK